MPKTKNYRALHERVLARPGAAERVAAHREEALAEIGLYELRQMEGVSQVELAARLKPLHELLSGVLSGVCPFASRGRSRRRLIASVCKGFWQASRHGWDEQRAD